MPMMKGTPMFAFRRMAKKFVTCGSDGDIRIWPTEDSSDPIHKCIGEWSLSVRQKGTNLYVSTANNEIQILTFPEGERDGIMDRFVASVNQIAVSNDSEHIALAGEDMEVKLYNLAESSNNHVFDGLKGPCLSVSVTSNFVAASAGDGKLRIWDHQTKDLKKEIDCFPKVNSFANAELLCRIDFSPDGKLLAYPDKDAVILLNTSDWSESATLKCQEVTNHYSIVQFSPCGNYLVGTTTKGDIVIFHVSIRMVRASSKHPNSTTICGLMWNPTGNGQIVYTDTQGQLGIVSGCTTCKATDDEIFTDNGVDFGDVEFESDDEDNENAVSVEKLKKEVMGEVDTEEPELNFEESSVAPTPRPRTPEIPLQAPFMPSSTPEHLNPRYLCWNDVGIVRSYGSLTDEDSGKSIEIEFHNATFHNSMMLQNYQEYIMGSVSTGAVAVANTKQIYVIPLKASSKEWILKLDETSEEIVLIATSESLICFATSYYLVRVSSIFGTQRGVVSIPGPLVTMSSFQNSILIAYHSGAIRNGDQCINIKMVKFTGLSVESRDINAALGPEATLAWLGFTDMGTPAMLDSLGMLSLHPLSCNIWIPFCDTTKHLKSPSDNFFVTAVLESQQTVLGIKCRSSVYPSFTPTPTVCEINLQPTFAEPTTDKTHLEMNLFTWSNLQVSDSNKKFSETGLKAFALACKNNLDQRAVELMEIIGNQQLLNLSTKYALKMNKKLLADKLMELASKLMGEENEDYSFTTNNSQIITPSPVLTKKQIITPSPVLNSRKFSLNSVKKTPRTKPQPLAEPSPSVSESQNSDITLDISTSLATPIITDNEPINPFSKSANKSDDPNNPLSLLNKYAGVDVENGKENKLKNGDGSEKRKQPDSVGNDKQREKQRKLDRFMFSKRT